MLTSSSELLREIMEGITRIHHNLEVRLAPKGQRAKAGASALRAGHAAAAPQRQDPGRVAESAKALYEWRGPKPSKIRMLMTFQSQGGLSHVALAHYKVAQAFRACGNAAHGTGSEEVPLKEFQDAIAARHAVAPIAAGPLCPPWPRATSQHGRSTHLSPPRPGAGARPV